MTRREKKSYLAECAGNKLWKGKMDNVGWLPDERSVRQKNNPWWQCLMENCREIQFVRDLWRYLVPHPARWSSPLHGAQPSSHLLCISKKVSMHVLQLHLSASMHSSHANIPPHLCICSDGVALQLHRPPVPPICFPDGVLVCRSFPGCPLPLGSVRASPNALSPGWFHLHPQKNLL